MAEKLTAEEFKAKLRRCIPEAVKEPEIVKKMGGLRKVFQMSVTDIDYRWFLDCMAEPKFNEETTETPCCISEGTLETYDNMYSGKLSSTRATVTRKIKVKGSMMDAMKMTPIVPAIIAQWTKTESK